MRRLKIIHFCTLHCKRSYNWHVLHPTYSLGGEGGYRYTHPLHSGSTTKNNTLCVCLHLLYLYLKYSGFQKRVPFAITIADRDICLLGFVT